MQVEYGRVSHRFAGANLLCSDPRVTDDLVATLRAGLDPSAPSLIHRRASLPDERQHEFTLTSTTLEHETRHFHDYLVTPFGTIASLLRTLATYHGFQAIARLPTPTPLHQVPIHRWLSRTARNILPAIFPPTLTPVAAEAAKSYRQLNQLMLSGGLVPSIGVLRARGILEASAFLVQLQSVYQCYGDSPAMETLNRVLNAPQMTEYIWPFRVFWPSEPQFSTRLLAAALHWSLCGDPFAPNGQGDPAVRVARLVDYCNTHATPSPNTPASDLLESWARAFHERSVVETQKETIDRVGTAIAAIAKGSHLAAFGKELLEQANSLLSAAQIMQGAYAANPDKYIWPDCYLAAAEDWVAAPIRVLVWPGGVAEPPGLIGFAVEVGRIVGTTKIGHVFRGRYQTPGTAVLDDRACNNAAWLHAVCDLYFSDADRYNDPELEFARWHREDGGAQLWELL